MDACGLRQLDDQDVVGALVLDEEAGFTGVGVQGVGSDRDPGQVEGGASRCGRAVTSVVLSGTRARLTT